MEILIILIYGQVMYWLGILIDRRLRKMEYLREGDRVGIDNYFTMKRLCKMLSREGFCYKSEKVPKTESYIVTITKER